MKKILYFLSLIIGVIGINSCSDNSNWNVLHQEFEPDPEVPEVTVLYVTGNHQGWKPESAPQIYALEEVGAFGGYIKLNGEFKFISLPSWDGINYGNGGDNLLSTDSEVANIVAEDAYYYITANTTALTYTMKPLAWGIIGDATPTGWDADTKMVYDPATNTLKLDLTLIDGVIKFRANDAWDDNFGIPKEGTIEDPLVAGGENIPVKAGDYTIELDLSTPVYTVKLTEK
jgi:hypothetical protein